MDEIRELIEKWKDESYDPGMKTFFPTPSDVHVLAEIYEILERQR